MRAVAAARAVHRRPRPGRRRPPGGAPHPGPGRDRRVREGQDRRTVPARQAVPRPRREDHHLEDLLRLPARRPHRRRTWRSTSPKPRWCGASSPTGPRASRSARSAALAAVRMARQLPHGASGFPDGGAASPRGHAGSGRAGQLSPSPGAPGSLRVRERRPAGAGTAPIRGAAGGCVRLVSCNERDEGSARRAG